MTTAKYCEDCKHHVPFRLFFVRHPEYDKCKCPAVLQEFPRGRVVRIPEPTPCSVARDYGHMCGRGAKHFEAIR